MRLFLAFIAQYILELHQMDVATAFFHAYLEANVDVEVLKGEARDFQAQKVC